MPEALSVDSGQPDAIRHCLHHEQQARDQLSPEWNKFKTADRNLCVGPTCLSSVIEISLPHPTLLQRRPTERILCSAYILPTCWRSRFLQQRSLGYSFLRPTDVVLDTIVIYAK